MRLSRYRQFLTNHFQIHMLVVDDERRNPIDLGSWVKGQMLHAVYQSVVGTIQTAFLKIG